MADDNKTSTDLSHERTGLSHERTGLSHERTDLSVERTLLAHERTLMAWIRTATSLISFGFTIYKAFDLLANPAASRRLFGPRELAMSMIGIGLVSLVFATIEHARSRSALEKLAAVPPRRSLAMVVAFLVAALGVATFVTTALHR